MTQLDQVLKALYDEERRFLAEGDANPSYLTGLRFAIRAARDVQRD